MKPVLEVNGLTVEYPDGFVLHPVSFSLGAGETLAVIGESGSGKTTLVRAIADLFSCRWARVSGEVLLDGEARVREVAQMLSGSDITEAAINNAKELLKK